MIVYSLTEIRFFKTEISSPTAKAAFVTANRMQAAVFVGRYFVTHLMTHRILFKNHIDIMCRSDPNWTDVLKC